jgi:rfaE bifunctional protein nucleotidyltransferase chain/domain
MSKAKILSEAELAEWVAREQASGRKVGFTCGAFDILHAGHVDYLTKARGLCDRLVVAVNSDESVRTYKNPFRPINSQEQRMQVIAALECVDAVTLMKETRPLRLLQLLRPDFYIKGGDYEPSKLRSGEFVRSYGGEVAVIPVTVEASTTAILRRIGLIEMHESGPEPERAQPARIVFLDRDGTLIRNIPFLNDPRQVELLPGVVEGLKALQAAGFRLVLVTNQQGIGLGYVSRQEFIAVNQELLGRLGPQGVRVSRIYYCPHSMADQCVCRKPSPYLFERGLKEFQAEPRNCYVVGDSAEDIEGGRRAGCSTVLVGAEKKGEPDAIAPTFLEAAEWILSRAAEA